MKGYLLIVLSFFSSVLIVTFITLVMMGVNFEHFFSASFFKTIFTGVKICSIYGLLTLIGLLLAKPWLNRLSARANYIIIGISFLLTFLLKYAFTMALGGMIIFAVIFAILLNMTLAGITIFQFRLLSKTFLK